MLKPLAGTGLAPLAIIFENSGMTGKVSEDCSRSNSMPIFKKIEKTKQGSRDYVQVSLI